VGTGSRRTPTEQARQGMDGARISRRRVCPRGEPLPNATDPPAARLIWMFEKLGWVHDVHWPQPQRLDAKHVSPTPGWWPVGGQSAGRAAVVLSCARRRPSLPRRGGHDPGLRVGWSRSHIGAYALSLARGDRRSFIGPRTAPTTTATVTLAAVSPDDRPEAHNSGVDEKVAETGACAQVHLPSGRTCTLGTSPSGRMRLRAAPSGAGLRRRASRRRRLVTATQCGTANTTGLAVGDGR